MPWLDKEYFHPNHDRNKENNNKSNNHKTKNELIASLGIEFIPCGTHEKNSKRPLNVSQIDDDNDDNNDNDYGGMTIIKEKNSTLRQAVSSTTHIEGSVIVPAPNLRPYINGIPVL